MPKTTAADDILNFFFFFFFFFSKKTSLDISCESFAWQTIHMKYQDLFSLKIKKNKNKCRLLQILLGAVRVKGDIDNFYKWSQSFKMAAMLIYDKNVYKPFSPEPKKL